MANKRKWTEEQYLDICNLYTKQGLSISEISKKYSTRQKTISNILKINNITIRPKGTSKNTLLNHNYFSSIDSSNKAYFLGLLFTDGSIQYNNQRSPSVRLELIESDVEILQILKKELNSNCSLTYNKRNRGTYSISIRSQQIVDDLKIWNIVPNKTYTIDQIIIPKIFEIDYLRGFIDGDGSIWQDRKGYTHTSICGHSKSVISQIAELGNKLIEKEKRNKIQFIDNVYRYTWNGYDADKLNKILYYNNCISITRKREKAMALLRG